MRGIFGLLMSAVVVFAGCTPAEILGRVEGRVTYEGQPVAKACLVFENQPKGVFIVATLDADGRYVVSMDKGYGLPLGEYEVSVSPPPPDYPTGPVTMEPPPPRVDSFPNIPAKYRDKTTSGVKLVVKEGVNRLDVAMVAEESP